MNTRQFVIQYGFLPQDQYLEMSENFPKDMSETVRSHGDLYYTDRFYWRLMEQSPGWMKFNRMVYSKIFWAKFLRNFNMKLPAKFDSTFREPRNGVMPEYKERFVYARLDIGVGFPGYGLVNGGRGTHIDNTQRIVSGLLYFTGQNELEGGEFEIVNQYGGLIHRVPLAQNMAILSLQNKDAWHRVNPLMKGIRRACYFALSASWKYWER